MKLQLSEKQVSLLGWTATIVTISSFTLSAIYWLRIVNLIGCFTWITYGFMRKDKPIIVTNVIIATIQLFMLFHEPIYQFFILLYRKLL